MRERYAAWLDGVEADVAVVEIPLLYETGAEALFDAVVVITAPEELRVARRGEAVAERSSRLISDDVKAGKADFAYVNDGPLEGSMPLFKPFWGDFELTPKLTLDRRP